MYVEERMYTLHPGKAPEYFKHYGADGLAVQLRHLLHLVGCYVTGVGPQNLVVPMWGHDDLNQREKCHAALHGDPAWQAYPPRIRPLVLMQDTRIMKCAPFFVERLKKMLAAVR